MRLTRDFHEIIPAQDFNEFMEDTVVYGPLCMQIDVIRESIMLPPLEKGDLVVIKPVGAYNVTQWMQFIAYRPAVVLIGEDQQVDVIREREDLEYIIEKERIPERLKAISQYLQFFIVQYTPLEYKLKR